MRCSEDFGLAGTGHRRSKAARSYADKETGWSRRKRTDLGKDEEEAAVAGQSSRADWARTETDREKWPRTHAADADKSDLEQTVG